MENRTDLEGGSDGAATAERAATRPQMDEIIPVYRRDCHEEVGNVERLGEWG